MRGKPQIQAAVGEGTSGAARTERIGGRNGGLSWRLNEHIRSLPGSFGLQAQFGEEFA
jgi:hypothetical protein